MAVVMTAIRPSQARPDETGRGTAKPVVAYLFTLVALLLPAICLAVQPEVDAEIRALLSVVSSSGCDFKRNGTLHSSTNAAEHLALKYSRGERYAATTEDFIDRLASKSSCTGKAYGVVCQGDETPSGEWLHARLLELRTSALES